MVQWQGCVESPEEVIANLKKEEAPVRQALRNIDVNDVII